MLTNTLDKMELKNMPRMNVEEFNGVLTELVNRIDGTGSGPNDLSMMVASTYLGTGIDVFAGTFLPWQKSKIVVTYVR